jgi:hypothetical protein
MFFFGSRGRVRIPTKERRWYNVYDQHNKLLWQKDLNSCETLPAIPGIGTYVVFAEFKGTVESCMINYDTDYPDTICEREAVKVVVRV